MKFSYLKDYKTMLRFTTTLIIVFYSFFALAAEPLPECLISFELNNDSFEDENSTYSCELIEESREGILVQYEQIDSDLESQLQLAISELESVKASIDELDSLDNIDLILTPVTNFGATVGLVACVPTVGWGCGLAALGYITTKISLIKSAKDNNTKKKYANQLRNYLGELITKAQSIEQDINKKDTLIQNFNDMCKIVQEKCL